MRERRWRAIRRQGAAGGGEVVVGFGWGRAPSPVQVYGGTAAPGCPSRAQLGSCLRTKHLRTHYGRLCASSMFLSLVFLHVSVSPWCNRLVHLRQSLNVAVQRLTAAGVPSSRSHAEHLISFTVDCDR